MISFINLFVFLFYMKVLDFVDFMEKYDDKTCFDDSRCREELYLLRHSNLNFAVDCDVESFSELLEKEQIFIVKSIFESLVSLYDSMSDIVGFLKLIEFALDDSYVLIVESYLLDLRLGLDNFVAKSRLLIKIKKDYSRLDIDYNVLNDVIRCINVFLEDNGFDV